MNNRPAVVIVQYCTLKLIHKPYITCEGCLQLTTHNTPEPEKQTEGTETDCSGELHSGELVQNKVTPVTYCTLSVESLHDSGKYKELQQSCLYVGYMILSI